MRYWLTKKLPSGRAPGLGTACAMWTVITEIP
jgi:hypothetical protein